MSNPLKSRQPRTFFEQCVANGGVLEATRAVSFVITLQLMLSEQDLEIGPRGGDWLMERYADFMGYSRPKAYRLQRSYRKCVPAYPEVLDLIEQLNVLQDQQHARSAYEVRGLAIS